MSAERRDNYYELALDWAWASNAEFDLIRESKTRFVQVQTQTDPVSRNQAGLLSEAIEHQQASFEHTVEATSILFELAHQPIDTKESITRIATAALFHIYESDEAVSPEELRMAIRDETKVNYKDAARLIDALTDASYIRYEDKVSQQQVIFGTKGLWLLEDAFSHGYETSQVDSMTVAEGILDRDHFFNRFSSQE